MLKRNFSSIEIGIQRLADEIFEATRANSHVWLMGNGGSASTVEHFETDLLYVRTLAQEGAFYPSAMAITTNSSLLTAVSNDVSFSDVFATILKRRCRSGDLVVLFSVSGNSPNLLRAAEIAKLTGAKVFGVLGFDGGLLKLLCDEVILVSHAKGDYGPVEDIHLTICHAVAERLKARLAFANEHVN